MPANRSAGRGKACLRSATFPTSPQDSKWRNLQMCAAPPKTTQKARYKCCPLQVKKWLPTQGVLHIQPPVWLFSIWVHRSHLLSPMNYIVVSLASAQNPCTGLLSPSFVHFVLKLGFVLTAGAERQDPDCLTIGYHPCPKPGAGVHFINISPCNADCMRQNWNTVPSTHFSAQKSPSLSWLGWWHNIWVPYLLVWCGVLWLSASSAG